MISLGTLDKIGYKYKCQGGVVRISKGALVVMKGLLQKGMCILQRMASTTTFKCPTPKVRYLQSFMDCGDLLGIDNVENHGLHTRNKSSKFLISNVAFDVPTLVKQIKGTWQGQVDKPRRKVELEPKAP
ncbi:hypothetical protein CRG98_034130 [Punica granatum]|uniref:Uncharacterized protein n=1 Tax=Punica granatum TaxID=22663 RepID=A0A2I0INB1_PUNGR|nr:hypothetical protein CRG98_034130 [Punica granatum]